MLVLSSVSISVAIWCRKSEVMTAWTYISEGKFYHVSILETPCLRYTIFLTSVMVWRGENVLAIASMWSKRCLLAGLLCMHNFVRGGTNGVALKFKLPKMASWSDNEGSQREDRRRLNVRIY